MTAESFLTVVVADRIFALPAAIVRDLIKPQPITTVPYAPDSVAGIFNLRGRIVTVIDLRDRLGMEPRDAGATAINVIVESGGELYALVADDVDEVMTPDAVLGAGGVMLDVADILPVGI